MSKTFVFTPVSTHIIGKKGRERVFKILKKILSIPSESPTPNLEALTRNYLHDLSIGREKKI